MADEKSVVIGIDLGTTYSAVAYVDEHGDAKIIPNSQSDRITPSVVLFEDKEGEVVVGKTAKDESELYPEKIVAFVKREIGKNKDEVRTDDNNGVPMPFDFWGKRLSPEDVSGYILKKLKKDAEEHLGVPIIDAVITVPAYFIDSERKATEDAGKIAGLNVLHILNEPTAAALAYGVMKADKEQSIFVFDLGGGTFDVTTLKIDFNDGEKEINMIQTDGDHRLGGKDWDDRLIEYCRDKFLSEHGEDPIDDPDAKADMRVRAERTKKALSDKDKTTMAVSAHGKKMRIELTREKFEELTSDLLERCNDLCNKVLEESNLRWSDIDTVLLVGGSTRMPMVRELIQRISGKEIQSDLINPDEAVALGAAIKAKSLIISDNIEKGNAPPQEVMDKIGKVKAVDVTSHDLGMVVVADDGKEFVSKIIRKGTKIPCTRTETYGTIKDNQSSVLMDIKEGESENPAFTPTIQEATLPIINPLPKGAPIEVTYNLRADGMLIVIGKDVTNNEEIRVEIKREGNLSNEEFEQSVSFANSVTVTG